MVDWVAAVWLVVLPVAVGAAVLRYRLYDLDRIISRTVAYGLLTLVLGGGYAAVVLGLGQLLGREFPLVVAAATLAVAALFGPARRRIQAVVDRRFNRRRHDTTRMIEDFGARLRDQVELDTLTAELLGGGRPDHAADPGIAVAASPPTSTHFPRVLASAGLRWNPDGAARDSNPQPPDP